MLASFQSDLKAILLDTDAREEREKASASVYALLSSIPIDDLASNGESMVSSQRGFAARCR